MFVLAPELKSGKLKKCRNSADDNLSDLKIEKNEKSVFYGTQNRGIGDTCLQRKRGTVNQLCFLPKVIVY
jgi:hypothetical protein